MLKSGEATWDEALPLFLERSGYPEETYHTFSYSPLYDDFGGVAGMLCVVTEETLRVIGERRLAVLRDLAAELSSTKSEQEIFSATERCLAKATHDFPFALTYLCDASKKTGKLAILSGVVAGSPAAQEDIDCTANDGNWPFEEVLQRNEPVVIDGLSDRLGELPAGPWPKAPQKALLVPISESGQTKPTGIFIAGINPFRPLDDTYRSFIGLFVGQLAAGISSAHAYQAEKRRAEALAEIDRAKTTFFSNVSHEFRTPLTLILGPLTDLLDEHREFPNQAAEELRVVHRNSLRLLKLVNSLLDFSRIEAGRVKATYLPTDLAAFTNDLASMFRSATDKAGLTYTIETRPLSQPAYVDREMWEKIVLNLLSNAFKFTLKGGISVRLFEEDGWIRLIVSDTGSGISTLELPRLFERFHRVEGTKGRTHEGTEIGLALVAELIKLHGGTIDVASELDKGSTFRVSLPPAKVTCPPNASVRMLENNYPRQARKRLSRRHCDGCRHLAK